MNTQTQIDTKELVENLNDLIIKNYDASKGFRKAAEHIANENIALAFREAEQQRIEFAGKLIPKFVSLGAKPADSTSTLSALHRSWIDLKASLTGENNDSAILEACIVGEKYARDNYDKLLDKGLNSSLRQTIQEQRNIVNDSVQKLRILSEKLS